MLLVWLQVFCCFLILLFRRQRERHPLLLRLKWRNMNQISGTTGRGTPTGHALAPVLKVTANRATYQNMIDNMDIDASGVTEGEVSIEEAGASMLDEVLEVCNGKTTKAESYGFSDIAIDRICRFI